MCQTCFYDGSEIRCVRCSLYYHLECAHLKRPPRSEFVCKKCKTAETQRPRRRHSHSESTKARKCLSFKVQLVLWFLYS